MTSEDAITCPTCGDPEVEVVNETAQHTTIRCIECGHVWKESPRHPRFKDLPLVVSDGEASSREIIQVATADQISVGDEFMHNDHRLLVTAIEAGPKHVRKTLGVDATVLHAKVFDTVPLKISVNEDDVTTSYRMDVEPEMEVHIGQVILIEGRKLAVKTLKSDQNRTLHRGFLLARNIRRAFCDPVKGRRRAGDKVSTRKRGAPPGAKRRKR